MKIGIHFWKGVKGYGKWKADETLRERRGKRERGDRYTNEQKDT